MMRNDATYWKPVPMMARTRGKCYRAALILTLGSLRSPLGGMFIARRKNSGPTQRRKELRMPSYRTLVFAHGLALIAGLVPATSRAETSIFVQAAATGAAAGTYSVGINYYSPVGLSVQNSGPLNGTTATYSPTAAATGQTAITLAAAVNGIASGSATASADLRTGFVKATASSDNYQSGGKGFAELDDDLKFSVVGGGSRQITVISHLDGVIGSFANTFSQSALSYILNFGTSGNNSSIVYTSQGSQSGFVFSARGASSLTPDGWDSYTLSNLTATGFDFTGLITINDGELRTVRQQLFLNCQEGVNCDFSHTGSIALQLPPGVSFTSGSGVFLTPPLTNAVPEPASWLMILSGFGMIGGVMRHRRVAYAVAAKLR
jgi:hypothetical protein